MIGVTTGVEALSGKPPGRIKVRFIIVAHLRPILGAALPQSAIGNNGRQNRRPGNHALALPAASGDEKA
jgi:hypothetical protein